MTGRERITVEVWRKNIVDSSEGVYGFKMADISCFHNLCAYVDIIFRMMKKMERLSRLVYWFMYILSAYSYLACSKLSTNINNF
jgi:hypothetical protein